MPLPPVECVLLHADGGWISVQTKGAWIRGAACHAIEAKYLVAGGLPESTPKLWMDDKSPIQRGEVLYRDLGVKATGEEVLYQANGPGEPITRVVEKPGKEPEVDLIDPR